MRRHATVRTLATILASIPVLTLLTAPAEAAPDPAAGARPAEDTAYSASLASNAVDFQPGSGLCGTNSTQSVGWQFNVGTEVTVVAMTWFDDGQNGLEISHEVGIWDPSGTLISNTHVTIPAGNAATLDGIWRVVPITPVQLPVGNGYIVGGYNGVHGECLSFNVTQVVNPAISYVDATFSGLNGIFERPSTFSGADNGFYGAGFQLELGAVSVDSESWGSVKAFYR